MLLEEHVEERILTMRKEGYTSGELLLEDLDGVNYRGDWSFSYVDPD